MNWTILVAILLALVLSLVLAIASSIRVPLGCGLLLAAAGIALCFSAEKHSWTDEAFLDKARSIAEVAIFAYLVVAGVIVVAKGN